MVLSHAMVCLWAGQKRNYILINMINSSYMYKKTYVSTYLSFTFVVGKLGIAVIDHKNRLFNIAEK